MNNTAELTAFGQSIWLDYIRRDLIETGELADLIRERNVRGVTSNPSIFEKAISGSDLYTSTLRRLAWAGYGPESAFDVLSAEDIRAAADVFMPLYEETDGGDGYVSLEVNPRLAHDTQRTLQEARRIWEVVNRPNLMVKIPATLEGLPAIEDAVFEGININVTLIFSLHRYSEVMEAYLRGLERRVEKGYSIQHLASVASFFVSRIDSAVDSKLEAIAGAGGTQAERAEALMGSIAVTSAQLAYAQFKSVFEGERFRRLKDKGARVQRPLWASTSTKNPAYPDTMYVDSLIGPDTVTTLPPETLEAFSDHGKSERTLDSQELSSLRMQLEALSFLGISLEEITDDLEKEGVKKFANAYEGLLKALETSMKALRKDIASVADEVEEAMAEMRREQAGRRIWGRDVSLWTDDEEGMEEAGKRLGWLALPEETPAELDSYQQLLEELREDGIERVLWLGMGGSSLAADVLSNLFPDEGGLQLRVLDSTDPLAVSDAVDWAEPRKTLYVTASKSGTTAEPLAMLDFFWEAAAELGEQRGRHFAVVTDPGSALEKRAETEAFRKVIKAPSSVGGRYSALSAFGMLPAVLLGVDAETVLEGARSMAWLCGPNREPSINPGLSLAALMAAGVRTGRSILHLPADPELENLADWIEQLIAESSGKDGKGILPIVGQKPTSTGFGARDMVVYLRSSGEYDRMQSVWRKAGVPFCALETGPDAAGIGAAFFQWEFATAAACALLDVNAFDQPNVQLAKTKTVSLLDNYQKSGQLPSPETLWEDEYFSLAGSTPRSFDSLAAAVKDLALSAEGSYLALLVFLPQTSGHAKAVESMVNLFRQKANLTVSSGFGPRYLHSTGQLHKGGFPGAYLVVTMDHEVDVEIPNRAYGFGVFEKAQALGDLQSLMDLDRPALWLRLKNVDALAKFVKELRKLLS